MNINSLQRQNILRRRGLASSASTSAPVTATAATLATTVAGTKNGSGNASVGGNSRHKDGNNNNNNNNKNSLSQSKENIIANAARRRLSSGSRKKALPRRIATKSSPASAKDKKPTLLQRRKMEPLSPLTFNFESPSNGRGFVGKTYITSKLLPLKKKTQQPVVTSASSASAAVAVVNNTSSSRGDNSNSVAPKTKDGNGIPPKHKIMPMAAKLAAIKKLHRPFRGHGASPLNQNQGSAVAGATSTATVVGGGAMSLAKKQVHTKQHYNALAKSKMLPITGPAPSSKKQTEEPISSGQPSQTQSRKVLPMKNMPHRRPSFQMVAAEAAGNPQTTLQTLHKNAESTTPPKHPMSMSSSQPAKAKEQQLQTTSSMTPSMKRLVSKYGNSPKMIMTMSLDNCNGNGNGKSSGGNGAPSKCETPTSHISLESKKYIKKSSKHSFVAVVGRRSCGVTTSSASSSSNNGNNDFIPSNKGGAIVSASTFKHQSKANNRVGSTPRGTRYAKVMETRRSRSLSVSSRDNGESTSPPENTAAVVADAATSKNALTKKNMQATNSRGRSITRADVIGKNSKSQVDNGGSGSSSSSVASTSSLPPTKSMARARLIEMHKRKTRSDASVSSRLQNNNEKADDDDADDDDEALQDAMMALTTVSVAVADKSLYNKQKTLTQQEDSTRSNKLGKRQQIMNNRGRSITRLGSRDSSSTTNGGANTSTTSPLPPRSRKAGIIVMHQQRASAKANKNVSATAASSGRARSLSLSSREMPSSNNASLRMTTSIESVPSSSSGGLQSVPSSESQGINSLGVTQSCSFTTNNGGSGEEMTQLQLRRKRAREVLARRNKAVA